MEWGPVEQSSTDYSLFSHIAAFYQSKVELRDVQIHHLSFGVGEDQEQGFFCYTGPKMQSLVSSCCVALTMKERNDVAASNIILVRSVMCT